MPKLPTGGQSRDSQLLEKGVWSRGEITPKQGWVPKIPTKRAWNLHLKFILFAFLAIVVLIIVYAGAMRYLPGVLNKAGISQQAEEQDYPIKTSDITFPSDIVRDKFEENVRLSSVERDPGKKYQLFEDNYILLRGIYFERRDSGDRARLEAFGDYIKKNFPQNYAQSAVLYQIPCVDDTCPKVEYGGEIGKIRDMVISNKTMDAQVKDAILKNFDAAVESEGSIQANYYLSAFSILSSVAKQGKDDGVREAAVALMDYITKNYPDVFIPDDLKL